MRVLRLAPLLFVLVVGSGAVTTGAQQRLGLPRVLYASDWSGSFQIYATDPSGRRPTGQLTFGRPRACAAFAAAPCGFLGAAPSPDGERVLLWAGPLQALERDLYVARADGRGLRRIGQGAPPASWSPDSRRIVYAAPNGIHVVAGDGSGNRLLPETGPGDRAPAWSPDGRSVALVARRGGLDDLVVITGRSRRAVLRGAGGVTFAWSRDGRRLAVATSRRLLTVRPDGTGLRRLASFVADYEWSPTDPVLAFTDREGLKLTNAAGTSVRLLSGGGATAYEIAWAPDGMRLAYARPAGGIRLVASRTRADRALTSDIATDLAWSQDGRSLTYLARRDEVSSDLGVRDLRIAALSGRTRTVVAASGRHGGSLGARFSPAWTRPPAPTRYRAPASRTLAAVSPSGLEAPWTIERIAADGSRVAYVACGHIFVWTPGSGAVAQAEPTSSLSPACPSTAYFTSYHVYSLELAGTRVAFGNVYGGIGRVWWLGGLSAPGGPDVTLARGSSTNGPAYGGTLVGELAGSGDLLAFSSWTEASGPSPGTAVTSAQEVRRAPEAGCPCPVLATTPGPLVPFDVDSGRVVAGGDNETWLLDAAGTRLLTLAVAPAAARLSGRDLVLVRRGELRHYDAATGDLLHTWPLPDVTAAHECATPNQGRCPREEPRLVLQDTARSLAAYALSGSVRLVRLSDGAEATVGPGTAARFVDAGLVIADGPRLRLVRFDALPF